MPTRLRLPAVYSPTTDLHDVTVGFWCGVSIENDELAPRAHALRDACAAAGAVVRDATAHGMDALARVHDRRMLDVLAEAHAWWVRDGHLDDPGNPYVTPYYFAPVAGPAGGDPRRRAATVRAEIGRYAMDTMTLIGAHTWEAVVAAADTAMTAADLVLAGERAAYAITRPPGHHAGPAFFGGSCYVNNTAAAAAHLRANGVERVAIIDIDAHHGNGTQAIFWNDASTLTCSVHIDPGQGWFPHTVGYADERDDTDTNLNVPVGAGDGDQPWLTAIDALITRVRAHEPQAVVVALGVDAAAEDANSPMQITTAGFAGAGERIAALGLPTVLVHEGGYVVETIGANTVAVLGAF